MVALPLSDDQSKAGRALVRRVVASANQAGGALEFDSHLAGLHGRDLPFLDLAHKHRMEREVRIRLYNAASDLLSTLSELSEDDDLWSVLERSEDLATGASVLSFRHEVQLREIVSHDVPALLRSLGYVTPPPPPAEQWAEWLQRPFALMLSSGPTHGLTSRNARTELRYFLMRMRRVLRASNRWLEFEDAQDEYPFEDPFMRRVLRIVVETGREHAVPAAILAACGFLTGGPMGAVGGLTAELGVGLYQGIKREFWSETYVGVAALTQLSSLKSDAIPATAAERLSDAFEQLRWGVDRLLRIADDTSPGAADTYEFLTRRAVYEALQVLEDKVTEDAWSAAHNLLDALTTRDYGELELHMAKLALSSDIPWSASFDERMASMRAEIGEPEYEQRDQTSHHRHQETAGEEPATQGDVIGTLRQDRSQKSQQGETQFRYGI